MLSITRLPDAASTTCEPHDIATTIKSWLIADDVPQEVLDDMADRLQDRWVRGENTRRLEFSLGVMIERI
jgi:benzoyl-CoA reductase/2-hydroxyglutaryl-CoA dehydratase subunit BcrC/BadD/HgdB